MIDDAELRAFASSTPWVLGDIRAVCRRLDDDESVSAWNRGTLEALSDYALSHNITLQDACTRFLAAWANICA